jgi:hypothetical protein
MKFKVAFARFPFGQVDHPDVTDWLVSTVIKAKADPEISEVISLRKDDTPITMTRNLCVRNALRQNVDFLLMVDNDMAPDRELMKGDPEAKPFWDTTWQFMKKRGAPCIVAAPYCGPPPISNIYVFYWGNWQNWEQNPQPDHRLEQYTRNEAAQMTGIQPVGALPTGLILIDMRIFDKLKPPWFYYEWKDEYADQKASTEDVTFSRDLGLLGIDVFCNWDAWAGHWKRICVEKPRRIFADQVSEKFKEAARNGVCSTDRLAFLAEDIPKISRE